MSKDYPADFENSVEHVFQEEGGWVNNKADRGKATNWGITKAAYARYKNKPVDEIPDSEIQAMPKSVAKDIYYEDYWKPVKLDKVNDPRIQKMIFSQVVNRGPGVLKSIKKDLGLDGRNSVVTEETLNKLNGFKDKSETDGFLVKISNSNREFKRNLATKPGQEVFARGWQRRDDNDLKAVGLSEYTQQPPPGIVDPSFAQYNEEAINLGYESQKAFSAEPETEEFDQIYMEVADGQFLFNDQILDIPPEQISIHIDEYENSFLLMRTETPVTTQSGKKRVRIIVNFSVDVGGGWQKLSKIITQIRKTPIATIENEKVRRELFGDYPDHENIGVIVDNISGYIEEGFPTLIRCTLQMNWFNHAPYIESIRYKERIEDGERLIYQTKPTNLYKKFYLEGTSKGGIQNPIMHNDPSFLTNQDSLVIMYKEYIRDEDTFVLLRSEDTLESPTKITDAATTNLRQKLIDGGWYYAEEDIDKYDEITEGVWYRWRKFEIPFSDFSSSSGALILQNTSFSLNTNPSYIGMEKYSIPTVQFLGGSTAQFRAIIFAAAEYENNIDKTPIGTSGSLAALQLILRKISDDRIKFPKFAKENHLLISHPLAKLMKYGGIVDSNSTLKYHESSNNSGEDKVLDFSINDFLPVSLSSIESQTTPGLPFASNVQIDFKETRLAKSLKSITYNGITGTLSNRSNVVEAQKNIIRTLYSRNKIYFDEKTKLGQVIKTGSNIAENVFGMFKTITLAANHNAGEQLIFPLSTLGDITPDMERGQIICDALNNLRLLDQSVTTLETAFNSIGFASVHPESEEALSLLNYSTEAQRRRRMGIFPVEWRESFNINFSEQIVVSLYVDFMKGVSTGADWVDPYVKDFEEFTRVRPKGYDNLYPDMMLPKDETNPAFYFVDNEKRVKNFRFSVLKNMPNNYIAIQKRIQDKLLGENFLATDFDKARELQKSYRNEYNIAMNYASTERGRDTGVARTHVVNDNNYRVFATQQAIADASPPTHSLNQLYPTFQVQLFTNRYAYGQAESASDLNLNQLRAEQSLDLLDVFDLSSILDIKIIKDEYEAADVMIIRIVATSKTLMTKQRKDPTYNPSTFSWKQLGNDIWDGKTTAGTRNTNLLDVGLQEGIRIRCSLGNSVISDELGLEFNGRIAAITGKDIIEIYCVSDGHELIQNTIGYDTQKGEEAGTAKYTLNSDTGDLIKSILSTSNEVKSFGNTKLEIIKNVKFSVPLFLGGRSAFDNIYAPNVHPSKTLSDFGTGVADSALSTFSTVFGIGTAAMGFTAFVGFLGLTGVAVAAGAAIGIAVILEVADMIEKNLYPCKFIVYKQTIWDVLQEMTLRHPGYIAAVVPFDRRSTIYFGEPDGIYFSRGVETAAEKAIVAQAILKSGSFFKTATLREIYDNNVNQKNENIEVSESSNQFSLSNPKGVQKNFQENFSKRTGQAETLTLMAMQKSFRSYHLITSENDIVSNDMEASAVDVANSVQVYHPKEDDEMNPDGTTWFSSYGITDYMKADDDLHSNLINNKVFTFHNAHNEFPEIELPQRYAKAILCKELENIYKGKITILGRHSIKPHDIIVINDSHNRISGPVKVGRVIQSISPESGWVTHIYPKFIAIPDTSAGAFQMKAILKAARYWLGLSTELFYSNMKKFLPEEVADNSKENTEFEKSIDRITNGEERVTEQEMTKDFDSLSFSREGEYNLNSGNPYGFSQTNLYENATSIAGQATSSAISGSNVIGYTVNDKGKKELFVNKKARMLTSSLEKLKSVKTKDFTESLKAFGELKTAASGVKVAGKGIGVGWSTAKAGVRLFGRGAAGFAGGFILESIMSSMIDGMVSYMKYRQPISIFPLTKEGKPWMAALNGYKENTIMEHIERQSVIAADRLGMTMNIIRKFITEWEEGMPKDEGFGGDYETADRDGDGGVSDGDTIKIKNNGQVEKVRIENLNTGELRAYPEYNKPEPGPVEKEMGLKAKAFLQELIKNSNGKVSVIRHGKDSTKEQRTIGTVIVNGINVRDELIQRGLALPGVIDYSKKLPPEKRNDPKEIAAIREQEWKNLKTIWEERNRRSGGR